MNPLFIICIFVRLSLVYLTYIMGNRYPDLVKPIGLMFAMLSIGFFIIEFFKLKQYGAFGNKVWWNRYVHSLFFAMFAYLTFQQNKKAYIVLLLDVIFGILHYIHNYTK
jgi:dipeptide/tripeptide permease